MLVYDGEGNRLTASSVFANEILDGAFARLGHGLLLQNTTPIVEAFRLIHGPLQGIALPAEHVIGMGAEPRAFVAPHEWVLSAGWPHAVELGGVPDSFEGDLRHPDGVGRRALGRVGEPVGIDGVVHVRLVVRAVEVLAVPAPEQRSDY